MLRRGAEKTGLSFKHPYKPGGKIMEQIVQGQVQKIATTVDECIRITIDTDSKAVPEGVNVLQWKNKVVAVALLNDVEPSK